MKQDWFHGLLCWLIAQYLRLVFVTGQWELRNNDLLRSLQQKGAVLPIMWHNRIAMAAFAWDTRKTPLTVLASGHRDGRLVTRTLSHFGMKGVSIPPKQSGSGAARQIIKILKNGESVVLTPDGPRGPRLHLKEDVLTIAKLSKAPIVLVTCNASRRKVLKSWDKFILPLPFSKGIISFASPPKWADGVTAKDYRHQLERALLLHSDEIDKEMGFQPIKPAPEQDNYHGRKGRN